MIPQNYNRSTNVAMEHNVWRLCVCLPLAQSFKLPQMLMGQIAQNRCYRQ